MRKNHSSKRRPVANPAVVIKHQPIINMRIVLFSDIHANLPALQAFFADAGTRDSDALYCLGDLVGYNVWPNEVIQEIRKRKIPTIAGNYDFGIGRASDDCGCAYRTDLEKANGSISISFTNQAMQEDERNYLRGLPAQIRVVFQLNGKELNLLLVHGSPRRINEYLFEDRDEKSLLRIMQDAGADILCFGHTHKPYHRILSESTDGKTGYRHAINTGSIGKPKDGDPKGGYVLLHIHENSSLHHPGGIEVEFVRFDYDIEKAARAIEDSRLPNDYAESLRKGK